MSIRKLLGVFVLLAVLVVPKEVFAEEMSEEFRKILNEDGKIVVNSVEPRDDFEAGLLLYDYHIHAKDLWGYSLDTSSCNETYTRCNFSYRDETHPVDIIYNYDENIKELVNNYTKDFPRDKDSFMVSDLEIINYWVNIVNHESPNKMLANYSGELKSYLGYKNFELNVDVRGGTAGNPFGTSRIGIATLSYKDTYYFIDTYMGVRAEYVMYVPDNTGNTKEDMIESAQERINEYVTGDIEVDLSYGGTAYEFWISYFYELTSDEWVLDNPNMTLEEFEQLKDNYIPSYNSFSEGFEATFNVSGINADDIYAIVDVHDENMGDEFKIIIKKDSSKMINPEYKSKDILTDVEISTGSNIPLDTFIQSSKLTSGEEYDKIMKLLDVKNSLTFDLKLYSNSLEKYITKLDNGTFEVKMPLLDSFDVNNLIVYYVDENDEVIDYDVDFKEENGKKYAVFTTDHFSVYTLASLGDVDNTVPNTFDSMTNSIITLLISLISLIGITLKLNKKNIINVK